MCRPNQDCDADRAARTFVGEWMFRVSRREAHDIAFILELAKAEGVRLASVGDVIAYCIRRVARQMAQETAYEATGEVSS